MNTVSVFYVVAQGAISAAICFVGIVVLSKKSVGFLTTSYWKWLVAALCAALLGPLTYTWMQSSSISYWDAATLRYLRAGAWNVARGYGSLVGVVLGGAMMLALRRFDRL